MGFRLGAIAAGVVTVLGVGMVSQSAEAALLPPGGLILPAPGEADPVGGSVLETLTVPVTASTFTGTLTSRVISGDTSNILGGLTFTYQFTNTDADSIPSDISRFTVIDFTSFLTDVSWQVGTGLNPTLVDRGMAPAGQEVGFSFHDVIGQGSVKPGQTTAVLVIQTNASDWVRSTGNFINGSVASAPALGPAAVPEPGALGLLGGAAMLVMRRRRR